MLAVLSFAGNFCVAMAITFDNSITANPIDFYIQYCQEITCQKPRLARVCKRPQLHLACVRPASAGVGACGRPAGTMLDFWPADEINLYKTLLTEKFQNLCFEQLVLV